LHQVPI